MVISRSQRGTFSLAGDSLREIQLGHFLCPEAQPGKHESGNGVGSREVVTAGGGGGGFCCFLSKVFVVVVVVELLRETWRFGDFVASGRFFKRSITSKKAGTKTLRLASSACSPCWPGGGKNYFLLRLNTKLFAIAFEQENGMVAKFTTHKRDFLKSCYFSIYLSYKLCYFLAQY